MSSDQRQRLGHVAPVARGVPDAFDEDRARNVPVPQTSRADFQAAGLSTPSGFAVAPTAVVQR